MVAEASRRLREAAKCRLLLLELYSEVVHRAVIKCQLPSPLLILKTDRTSFDTELPVLMNNEIKEKEDVETEYLDQHQPDNERAG